MADEGLKDFTITWIIGGLLIFCLLAFAMTFVYNNNPSAYDEGTSNILNDTYNDYSGKLIESSVDSNSLLNVTSNTNPEVSDLGSRDSVAVSFGTTDTTTNFWDSSKKMLSWVFSGTAGKVLLGTIGGILGFLSLFYIWRFIKTGI